MALLIAGTIALVPRFVPAQEPPSDQVGIIPGTKMSRDEFRALALVQLNAAALSAAAYKLVHRSYPLSLIELKQSESWTFDLTNIFSGQPVREIVFDPQPGDMFNQPAVGLGFPVELPPAPAAPSPQPQPPAEGDKNSQGDTQAGQNGTGNGAFDPNAMIQGLQGEGNIGPWRVNPGMVQDPVPGDIFYYAKDDLLQLIMFAPDGTYLEHVVEGTNPNWQRNLMVGGPFPDGLLAAEVLLFIGEQLPQYYNLVQFMGDRETIPMGHFAELGAAERIALAEKLGVVVLNPYTKKQIVISDKISRGDFFLDPTQPATPLRLSITDAMSMTLDELWAAKPIVPGAPEEKADHPKDHRGAPPMGGRKNKDYH